MSPAEILAVIHGARQWPRLGYDMNTRPSEIIFAVKEAPEKSGAE